DAVRNGHTVRCSQRSDPAATRVVEMCGDRAHRALRLPGYPGAPQGEGYLTDEIRRDAVGGTPGTEQRRSQIGNTRLRRAGHSTRVDAYWRSGGGCAAGWGVDCSSATRASRRGVSTMR